MYYLSKYYELLDTVLQLLQGKIPPNYALHVFHHCIVILIDWWWLSSGASIQFIGLLFNTFVHVVMYYYFYLKSTGVNPWWKKWGNSYSLTCNYMKTKLISVVTTLQIVQFMTSGVCFLVTLFLHYGLNSRCKGMEAVFASLLFNAVLLYGFVDVLNKTNKSARSNKSIKRSE